MKALETYYIGLDEAEASMMDDIAELNLFAGHEIDRWGALACGAQVACGLASSARRAGRVLEADRPRYQSSVEPVGFAHDVCTLHGLT